MPFPRRASDGDTTDRPHGGRAPVFTLRRYRQGIALRFLALRRSDKSICDPPGDQAASTTRASQAFRVGRAAV